MFRALVSAFTVLIVSGLPDTVAAQADAGGECELEAMIAEMMITHRQLGGYSLAEMIEKLGTGEGEMFRPVILAAYDQPRMLTEEAQQFAIDEFVNTWTLKCFAGQFVLPRVPE